MLGLKQVTIELYRRLLALFVFWCAAAGVEPEEAAEFDDLLVEFASGSEDAPRVTRSQFATILNAVERVCPHLKGHLHCARAFLMGWSVSIMTRHAVPLSFGAACLLAVLLCYMGMPTVGATLVIQAGVGLRPSEALSLAASDLVLPWEIPKSGGAGLLLLGTRTTTKAKRPQSVRVENPVLLDLMHVVRKVRTTTTRLTGVKSLGGYSWCLKSAAQNEGLRDVNWTPHSPRAGYVTDAHIAGKLPHQITAVTRHQSIKSLRSYLDATSVIRGELAQKLVSRQQQMDWCERHIAGIVRDLLAPATPLPFYDDRDYAAPRARSLR